MKLYQEHQVNPLGSCLPLVLQLPVFLALFYMLQNDLRVDICGRPRRLRQGGPDATDPTGIAAFLFINDLTDKATGGALIALIVLYIGSQLISSLLMPSPPTRRSATSCSRCRSCSPSSSVVPGRSDRLLDHDEHVDDRPAVLRAQALRAAAPAQGSGRARRPWAPGWPRSRGSGMLFKIAEALCRGGLGEAPARGWLPGSAAGPKALGLARAGSPPPSPRKKKKRSGRAKMSEKKEEPVERVRDLLEEVARRARPRR